MSLPLAEAEGFVLAGGRSSRMGQDKALVEIRGHPLVEHALGILRRAGLTSRIAGAHADLSEFAPVIQDEPGQSGLGPLAGICASLSACESRIAVFLPVDLPLIPAGLIEYLVHHATVTGAVATAVSTAGFVQSFPVAIDRKALGHLRDRLHSGDRNCLRAFQSAATASGGFVALPVEMLVQPGLVRHPRGLHPWQWFLNVNSSADLKQVDYFIRATDTL